MTKLMKISFLAFVILLCTISVSFATEDATDISDTVSTQTIEQQTVDTAKEVQTTSKDNNKVKTIENKKLRTTDSNDTYTFTNTTLDITGNSYDGHELTILDNVNVTSSNHMQLSNTVFKILGNNVNISGLNFKNFDNAPIVFTVIGSNVNITNNFINLTNVQALETKGVSIKNSSNVRVSNNTIYLAGVPQAAGWTNETGEWVENMKVSGIKAETSTGITINNNIVTITKSTETGETASSTDAITIKTCNNSQVENNTITIDGSDYIYGISATTFNNNITVFNNTVYLIGQNYICGVQFSSTSNSRAKQNKVYGNCTATSGACPSYEAFAYGVIDLTGTWGASTSEAVGNIIEENYVELDSTIAYAYELSNTDQTQVLNNNATITGNVVMGLGIYNSTNSNITGNKFNITGNTRTLNGSIYEAVPPETTGIKLVGDTTNIRITGNTITVKDTNSLNVYAVILECSGNVVTGNTLSAINKINFIRTKISAVKNSGNNTIEN